MRRASLVMTTAMVLALAGCSGDGGDGEPSSTPTSPSAAADTSGEPEAGPTTPAPGTSDEAVAFLTVDGTTVEMTEILDCTVGNEGFPDDRNFVGRSADGAATMDVAYFENESLAGLNGVSLEIEQRDGTVATVTWASSYAGADAGFDISLRDNGADGVAEVGVVGLDVPDGTFDATWSFTC